MDAQKLAEGAAGLGVFPVPVDRRSTSCRASSSTSSIAASRPGCRCSPASTAARSARCAYSRRRCRPTRRPMKRRSASATAISPTASCSSIPPATSQESMLRRPRATRCTAGPPSGWRRSRRRPACRPSSIYSITAIRPPMSRACTPSMPRDSLCVRHHPPGRRRPGRKVPETPVEALCRTRCSTTGRASRETACRAPRASRPGRPTAPSARYMAFEDAPLPETHLLPGMFELNEQVVCRRRVRAAAFPGTGMSASHRRRFPPRRRCR